MDKLEEIKVQLIDLKDGSATIDECAERILSLFSVSGSVCEHQNTRIKPTWQVGGSAMVCDDCGEEL